VSCETLEHVQDRAAAMAELARVLRPGGRLLLTTPNYLNLMGAFRGYLRLRGRRWTEGGQPLAHFQTAPGVLRLVRRSGLRLTAVDGCGHYVPFPGRSPVRIMALDGARRMTRWAALHTLFVAEKPARGAA
jgi:SAM-dependent methyltransferase